MISVADLAYSAGFIDADGSIIVSRFTSKKYRHGFRLEPTINGYSIDRHVLEYLADTFGGSVQKVSRLSHSEKLNTNFQSFFWRGSGKVTYNACKALIPYLRIKKQQAQLVVDFYDDALWKKAGSPTGIPDEEVNRRLAIRDRIISLNGRDYLERMAA